jgi:nitroreductase
MNLLPELEARRASRMIGDAPVTAEEVETLLEAARLAPSCFNNQPWHFVVCGPAADGSPDPGLAALRETLNEGNRWAAQAPFLVLLATETSLDCRLDEGRDYAYFDCGLAAMALMLEATRLGLVAHPMAGFSASKARKALGLPKAIVPLVLLAVGRPGPNGALAPWQTEKETAPRERKSLSEFAHRGRWDASW